MVPRSMVSLICVCCVQLDFFNTAEVVEPSKSSHGKLLKSFEVADSDQRNTRWRKLLRISEKRRSLVVGKRKDIN